MPLTISDAAKRMGPLTICRRLKQRYCWLSPARNRPSRKDRRKAEHAGSVNAFRSRGQHGRSSKPNRAAALSRRRRRVNLNERRL